MTDKHRKANAVTVMQLRTASAANVEKAKVNNASVVHATVMAVIAENVVASVQSKVVKMHLRASFLIKIGL